MKFATPSCTCTAPPRHLLNAGAPPPPWDRARPAAATVADSPDEDAAGASHHQYGTRETVPTLRRPVTLSSYPWRAAARTATEPTTAAVRRRFRPPPSVSDQGEKALATPRLPLPFPQLIQGPQALGRRRRRWAEPVATPALYFNLRKKKECDYALRPLSFLVTLGPFLVSCQTCR
jgi:hypothetical protein